MRVRLVGRVPSGHGHEGARPAGFFTGETHGAFRSAFHAGAGSKIAALIQQREAGEAINIEGLRTVIGLHILRPGDEILAVFDEVIHIEVQKVFGESGLGARHAGCAGLIVQGAIVGHSARIRHIGTVGTDGHGVCAVHVKVRARETGRSLWRMNEDIFLRHVTVLIPQILNGDIGETPLPVAQDGGFREIRAGRPVGHVGEVQVLEVLQAVRLNLAVQIQGIAGEDVRRGSVRPAAVQIRTRETGRVVQRDRVVHSRAVVVAAGNSGAHPSGGYRDAVAAG